MVESPELEQTRILGQEAIRMETALAVSQAKYWHLKQLVLFAQLSDWELRQLVNIADLRLFKEGEDVYRDGDLADRLFIVRTGKAKLHKAMAGDKDVILTFVGPGELFGETAITGEETRHESATVMEDAFMCMIDRDRFHGYLLEHPDLALRITRIISERKRAVERRVIDLLSKDVRTRLAHALVELADRYGESDDKGVRIDLRLTQTDLGQLVGSTRETTSMAFNDFRRRGYVDSKDRIVWVRDLEALTAL